MIDYCALSRWSRPFGVTEILVRYTTCIELRIKIKDHLNFQPLQMYSLIYLFPWSGLCWSNKQISHKVHPRTHTSMVVVWANADNKHCNIGSSGWHSSTTEPDCVLCNLSCPTLRTGACSPENTPHRLGNRYMFRQPTIVWPKTIHPSNTIILAANRLQYKSDCTGLSTNNRFRDFPLRPQFTLKLQHWAHRFAFQFAVHAT